VMNADGSPGVSTEAKVGATVHGALAVVIAGLALGLALLAGGAALVIRRRPR
jgi:nitrate reductase gamma subunit